MCSPEKQKKNQTNKYSSFCETLNFPGLDDNSENGTLPFCVFSRVKRYHSVEFSAYNQKGNTSEIALWVKWIKMSKQDREEICLSLFCWKRHCPDIITQSERYWRFRNTVYMKLDILRLCKTYPDTSHWNCTRDSLFLAKNLKSRLVKESIQQSFFFFYKYILCFQGKNHSLNFFFFFFSESFTYVNHKRPLKSIEFCFFGVDAWLVWGNQK